jgi:trehalose 6-phosphate phosphatase
LKVADSPPPRLDLDRSALFLDLDGTLAELAPRPDDVVPLQERTGILRGLVEAMHGRVAVLTGRALGEADRILEAAVVPVAAVHGLVRRVSEDTVVSVLPSAKLPHAKAMLDALAADHEGLLVEDKGASVALHYRQAPEAGPAVRSAAEQLAKASGLILQEGAMVSELRTPGPNKGDSLKAFMAFPPFAGSIPIAIGDDLTDEDAFAAAEALGGYGILVGGLRPTRARFRLGSVPEVLAWLQPKAFA